MRKNNLVIVSFVVVIAAVLIFAVMNLRDFFSPEKYEAKQEKALFQKAEALNKSGKYDDALFAYEEFLKTHQDGKYAPGALYALGGIYGRKGFVEKARNAYAAVIRHYSTDTGYAAKALEQMGNINIGLLFSSKKTPFAQVYRVQPGDTLNKIAKKYSTTTDLLTKANKLENAFLRPGMQLTVLDGKFSVIVDKSLNILTLKLNEEVFKVYRISTGRDNCSPVGTFTIVNKLKDPTWFKPGEAIPSGDPRNILGTRWMGFSKSGYGIHGTTTPETIGTQETAGCVRMKNEEAEQLYDVLPVGTEITIID